MVRKIIALVLGLLYSSFSFTEFIVMECYRLNDWDDFNELIFTLNIGTESKKAKQITRRGSLTMDFKLTEGLYELGQYTDETKTDSIPVIKIERDSLKVVYLRSKTRNFDKIDIPSLKIEQPIRCIKIKK